VLLTNELAETIRRCEIVSVRSGLEAARRVYPDLEVTSLEIAGGLARFASVGPRFSVAFGLGTLAQVSAGEIARLTDFYESRNAVGRVIVTPLSDPSLGRRLADAGYAPGEHDNVMVSDRFDEHALRDERIAASTDVDGWARASARGFLGVDTLQPGDERLATILASSENVIALEGRDDGVIAATGAMSFVEDSPALFAASTIAKHRGHGWHTALIRDRIARARDAGARFMRAAARPASSSERNFHRCGFTTLYTRVFWERRVSESD
jgi:GNAT superfamily N-acetyltransferase